MTLRYDLGELVTAMVTPMNQDGTVNYDKAEELANYLVENESDAILVAATTGESPTLEHEEELELLRARNEYLEAENAYLKKLDALVSKREAAHPKAKKQKSSRK